MMHIKTGEVATNMMVEDRNFDYKKEGDHKCKMLMVFMMMGRQSKWWESLDLSQHCKKSDISRKKTLVNKRKFSTKCFMSFDFGSVEENGFWKYSLKMICGLNSVIIF